jgi:hypothetical protein
MRVVASALLSFPSARRLNTPFSLGFAVGLVLAGVALTRVPPVPETHEAEPAFLSEPAFGSPAIQLGWWT